MRPHISILLITASLVALPAPALAFGDEGHEIVALIALHYLHPRARARVTTMLAQDASGLTASTDLPQEATWADKYRDSDRDTTRVRYTQTSQWHFIDIEIDAPDPDAACFHHPVLPPGTAASTGAAGDCIWDKINEFSVELANPATPPGEKLLALQFLLHLVGDAHQPLHAADRHDRGGNDVRVRATGSAPGNLHHYWDTVFVTRLGRDPSAVAQRLVARISLSEQRAWRRGTPRSWLLETFEVGRRHTYGRLPAGDGVLTLNSSYCDDAQNVIGLQLQRAGVRLARVLNDALE